MKFTLVILLLGLPILANSSDSVLVIKSKEQEFRLVKKDNLWVSESCLKSKCQALEKATIKKQKSEDGLVGHPAAKFCLQENGEYIVGKRESGDEDGVCLFKDKSFIIGWDYYRHNQKKGQQ